jgi:hypothetical protein
MTGGKHLHPTGLHRGTLSAQLLDFMCQKRLGLQELAAAADVIAAECRFDYWALRMKKAEPDIDRWMRLLDRAEANAQRCRAAIAAFSAGGSGQTFCRELEAVAAALNRNLGYLEAEPPA